MRQYKDTPYYVTEDGQVWRDGKQRKLNINPAGYYFVHLSIYGESKTMRIHKMVAQTYIPNPMNYPVINHKDGNKLNNHVSNLEWCTIKHNTLHSINELGNLRNGEKNPNSKLTKEQVKWIRENYIARDKQFGRYSICKKYNISPAQFRRVINHISWSED